MSMGAFSRKQRKFDLNVEYSFLNRYRKTSSRRGDTNLYGYVLSDPINHIDPRGLDVIDLTGGTTSAISNLPEFQAAQNNPAVTVLVTSVPGLTRSGQELYGLTRGNATNISVQINPSGQVEDFATLAHEFVHVNQLMNGQTGNLSEFEAYLRETQVGGKCK